MGGVAAEQGEHPHVGRNGRIHPQVLQKLQPLGQAVHFLVAGHGVAGHMDRRSPAAAERHGRAELLWGEIPREGAHTKFQTRQIDRVGPVGQAHMQPFHIPRRGEQFHRQSDTSCVHTKQRGSGLQRAGKPV